MRSTLEMGIELCHPWAGTAWHEPGILSMAHQGERGGESQGGPSPGRESAFALAPALIEARRRACRLAGPRRRPTIPIGIGRASGGGPSMEERRIGPRQATFLLGKSRSAEPAPALVQARRRACRLARLKRRLRPPPAPSKRLVRDRAWKRGEERTRTTLLLGGSLFGSRIGSGLMACLPSCRA